MKIKKVCQQCGKEFETYRQITYRKYCSSNCAELGGRNRYLGEYKGPHQIRELHEEEQRNFFWSLESSIDIRFRRLFFERYRFPLPYNISELPPEIKLIKAKIMKHEIRRSLNV